MAKSLTVKDLAQKYGASAQEIIRELSGQGIDLDKGEKSVIPEDMAELVDAYLDDIYNSEDAHIVSGKRGNSGNGKKGAPKRGSENQKAASYNNNRKPGAKSGGDHQHHDIRGVSSAGTHIGKRRVSRSVDEGDSFAVEHHG